MRQVFDFFVEYKKTDFDQYKYYINKVELRINSRGNKILYVESFHAVNLK